MQRIILSTIALISIALAVACASSASQNSDVAAGSTPVPPARRMTVANNANVAANTNQPLPGNVKPSNISANGAPGIDPKAQVRTLKPGEKIPGIPDPATLKQQMKPVDPSQLPPEFRNAINAQKAKPAANTNANTGSMMMMKKKPANQ